MAAEVTVIPDFWDDEFYSPRVPPGDQPLTDKSVDSGYEIGARMMRPINLVPRVRDSFGQHQFSVFTVTP